MTDGRVAARGWLVERIDGGVLLLMALLLAGSVRAAGSNMPWEGPLQSVLVWSSATATA